MKQFLHGVCAAALAVLPILGAAAPPPTPVLVLPDGGRYVGRLQQGLMHGRGSITWDDSQYDGEFVRGRMQGQGTLRRDDGTVAETPALAARNNEAVLYNQQALLQQQFSALQPSRGGPPQMYALFVAGDGSQEVFRREVAYVDALFARRFGTRDRAVRLVNSRSSTQRLPLATTHSIGQALQALAQKMDRERDLLFVFLTSHGSRTHELALGMNEMSLPDLPATRLGEMLKASGIRKQVVVVSACYSGGFVPPLQGENTWVITAARADRSSFGCADENDFTYFGRALFKESLPTAPTLSAAVTQAIARVEEWEARDAKAAQDTRKAAPAEDKASAEAEAAAHSEPQSVVSPAFRAEVDAWFAAH